MKTKFEKHRRGIFYFFKNAPLAIITSSLPGFLNYAVILFLTAAHSMADVGQYRLLISYFSIVGLFSIQQSSILMVRASVSGDDITGAALVCARFYAMAFVTAIISVLYFWGVQTNQFLIPEEIFYVALFACLNYPFDMFLSRLQAERKFVLLANISVLKYGVSLLLFIFLIYLGKSILFATMMQIAALTFFNVLYFCIILGPSIFKNLKSAYTLSKILKNSDVKEAFTLSLANLLPSTLEHVDKMVIGYFFGLEALGLYTLAFSTGRFIYNSLKPAFYIYYRHFVDNLPKKIVLYWVMAVFTVFGFCLSGLFFLASQYFSFFSKFEGAEVVVYILFLSYGIAMADAIYTQSYGINKKTKSPHLLISNVIISVICLVFFALCSIVSQQMAMIICALHYPVRHAGTMFLLSLLRKYDTKHAP